MFFICLIDCEERLFPIHNLKYTFGAELLIWRGEDSMFFRRKKGKTPRIMTRPWKFEDGICKPLLHRRDITLIKNIFQDDNVGSVTVKTDGNEITIAIWFKKTGLTALTAEKAAELLEANIPQGIHSSFQKSFQNPITHIH